MRVCLACILWFFTAVVLPDASAYEFMAKYLEEERVLLEEEDNNYSPYDGDDDTYGQNDNSYEYEDACVHCPTYIQSSAYDKEQVIMGKIRGTEYNYDKLPDWKDLCTSVERFEGVDFNNIFDRFSDERPEAFDRFFHFSGIVGSVKFKKVGDHNFTGIFQGADHGVLRFSPLAPLLKETFLVNHFIGTILFSFGLKFFRDGIHSGNINTGDSAKGLRAHGDNRQFYDKPNFNICK